MFNLHLYLIISLIITIKEASENCYFNLEFPATIISSSFVVLCAQLVPVIMVKNCVRPEMSCALNLLLECFSFYIYHVKGKYSKAYPMANASMHNPMQ